MPCVNTSPEAPCVGAHGSHHRVTTLEPQFDLHTTSQFRSDTFIGVLTAATDGLGERYSVATDTHDCVGNMQRLNAKADSTVLRHIT